MHDQKQQQMQQQESLLFVIGICTFCVEHGWTLMIHQCVDALVRCDVYMHQLNID